LSLASVPAKAGSAGRLYVVAQQNPSAANTNPGTSEKPFKTIGQAAALAEPGDTVLVHAGVYREWVAPARGGEEGHPITYQGAPGEQVIISGSEVYTNTWQAVEGHRDVFSTVVPSGFFAPDFNPFKIECDRARGGGRQGQVFVNGKEMREAKPLERRVASRRRPQIEKNRMEMMLEEPGTWSTEDGTTIYVHLPVDSMPMDKCRVEFSVRRHLFAPVRRAQNYIYVKGFIFEHCANDASFPQVGAVSCRSGQQWLIESNVIRQIKTVGIDCGAEDENPWRIPDTLPQDRFLVSGHHDIFTLSERRIAGRNLILNNIISDCGQCGIAGVFSDGSVIMGNVVERCGGVIPGFESGGIKIHGLMGGIIEGNLVRDNEAWGIWLDCGYIGSRVMRNVVVNNKTSGIFFECCNGPGLIANNVIAYNRGDGIYSHDASGISVANNLIFGNAKFGIYMCVATDRKVPPYHYATGLYETEPSACSWQRIYNNILAQNGDGVMALPYPSKRAQDNLSDNNFFAVEPDGLRFVQHFRNGETLSTEVAADSARRAFNQSGDGGGSAGDLAAWKQDKALAMTLSQSRLATSNDTHSVTGSASIQLNQETFDLTVALDKAMTSLQCRPVTTLNVRDFAKFAHRLKRDFLGHPMPEESWLPGAIQSFTAGTNRVRVWPVEFARPEMPPKVAIQPAPGSPGLQPVPPPSPRGGQS
jgi:parallel beta-helix repeat protein